MSHFFGCDATYKSTHTKKTFWVLKMLTVNSGQSPTVVMWVLKMTMLLCLHKLQVYFSIIDELLKR